MEKSQRPYARIQPSNPPVSPATIVPGLGFRVWGLGFGVLGLGFRVWGLGLGLCKVKGSGLGFMI